MSVELGSRKTIIIGAAVFILTLVWAFFLDQLAITPDSLLFSVGDLQSIGLFATVNFALFALFFSATLALITASADKDDRARVYVSTIVPSILACAVGALLFGKFAQWYPLALFYFGAIPLMLETSRMKRLELKNFVAFRSSFSGAQRGLQILGIGILVTLAIVALPQSQGLYGQFENSLFQGKVIQQLDVQKITADFLITTQRSTLIQVTESEPFTKLRTKTDPEVMGFVSLMDTTLDTVNSQGYRDKVIQQVKDEQMNIDTSSILSQVEKSVPGYSTLKNYYWVVAALLGSILFFAMATFVLQPLSAVFGTLFYLYIPAETYEETIPSEPAPAETTGWSAPPTDTMPPAPVYTHVEETPAKQANTPPSPQDAGSKF
ncbi:MAG: hypothetical protein AABW68_04115 [archaeon]